MHHAVHRVVSQIAIVRGTDEGLRVAEFSVAMFGEVAVLFMGVIFPHVDAAIPLMPPHMCDHQFQNGGLPTCLRRGSSGLRSHGAVDGAYAQHGTIRVLPSS